MNGDPPKAQLLRRASQLQCVHAVCIVSQAGFDGDGQAGVLPDRLHHPVRAVRVQQKRASLAGGHHLAGRTAHVDVQRPEASQRRDLRGGLSHHGWVLAKELAGGVALFRVNGQQAAVGVVAGLGAQVADGADHLGTRIVRAHAVAQHPHGPVRDARHGGQT